MEKDIDINLVLAAMRERIGALAQENAILQATLLAVSASNKDKSNK
jgi:hypothetical protein